MFPGDKKLSKEKIKRKSNQLEFEASKRTKRDDVNNGAKLGNSGIEGSCKDINNGHSIECNSAKEVKHFGGRLTVSVKNLSKQSKVSTDCTSMDLKESGFLKKRKLKGSEDNQIDGELHHHSMQDSKLMAEETDQCMLRKGKKSRFSDTLLRDTSSRDGNSRPKKEGKAIKNLSSEIKKHFTDAVEGDKHPSKDRKQLAPIQATSTSSKVSSSQKSRVNYEVHGSPVESVSSFPLRVTNLVKLSSVGHDVLTRGEAPNGVLPVMDNVGEGSGEKIGGKQSGIVVEKESHGFHLGSLESGTLQKDAKRFSVFRNGHNLDRINDYAQHGEFPVDHNFHENGAYVNSGDAVCLQKNGNLSSLKSNVKRRNSESDSDKDNVRTFEAAVENFSEHLYRAKGHESLVKGSNTPPFDKVQNHMNPDHAEKKVKNHARRDFSKQNKHAQSDGRINTLYSDYGLESPSENTCPDSNCRVEAAQMSAESMSSKEMLSLHLGEEGKGAPSQDSQLVGQRNICNGLPGDTAGTSDLSKALLRSKKNGTSKMERLTSKIDVKDVLSSSPSRACQSVQTACAVLKEAEKLRDLADRLKVLKVC